MMITGRTAALGLCFAIAALLAIIYFRRPRVAYLDPTDLPADFIEGFREGCDAIGLAPVIVTDDSIPNGGGAIVVTARPDLHPDRRRITRGAADPGAIHVIEHDLDALIRTAVDFGRTRRRAHRFVFLYDETAEMLGLTRVQYPTSLYLKTMPNPEKALEDSFAVVQTRVVDAFVVTNPDLEFDRDKFQQSKVLIACGYESAKADASVSYDAREQGYLAAVLSHNANDPLFIDKKIKTKIYVKEHG